VSALKEVLQKRIEEVWRTFREFEEALEALEEDYRLYPGARRFRRVLFTKLRLELDDFRLRLAFVLDNLEHELGRKGAR